MRFYDPDFGQVLIDGVDVKSYNLKELRERMGLVMQEPTLFNYTVKENILYGNVSASNKEVRDAVVIANATEFIESPDLHAVCKVRKVAILVVLELLERAFFNDLAIGDHRNTIALLHSCKSVSYYNRSSALHALL